MGTTGYISISSPLKHLHVTNGLPTDSSTLKSTLCEVLVGWPNLPVDFCQSLSSVFLWVIQKNRVVVPINSIVLFIAAFLYVTSFLHLLITGEKKMEQNLSSFWNYEASKSGAFVSSLTSTINTKLD